jgi:hypothetical protein
VEKKTPTNHPHPVGGGILKKEVCETKQITNARGLYCKPHTNGINLAQDVEKKKTEQRTPHFLSLDQDIVALPQEEKCGLKYVIYTFRQMVGEFGNSD